MNFLLTWIREALFPHKCLVCFKEGAVLCDSHRLEPELISPPLSNVPALETVFSVTFYQHQKPQQLVKKLKFSRQRSAALPMINALVSTVDWRLCQDYELIPIPLHWRRRCGRGFNQSLILANGISAKTGLSLNTGLIRHHSTAQQARLGRAERAKNMQQVFQWSKTSAPPAKVILIDDVCTTGATLNAAAQALRKSGGKQVIGVVFAYQSLND